MNIPNQIKPESEFHEFNEINEESQIRQKSGWIERRLWSWNMGYNFKRNQPYLSLVSNLNRGSNGLNCVSGC